MMNKKTALSFFILGILLPTLAFSQKYHISDLIRDYISFASPQTPLDFAQQDHAQEIQYVHQAWKTERNFWFYRPPEQLPQVAQKGLLYRSGLQHEDYQKELKKSYDLTQEIHQELESALSIACKICRYKQRIPLQNCPSACFP